jgi:hypothetical protein
MSTSANASSTARSAPVLARQYIALYRRLIASAAHAHKLRLRKQVTVAVSGRQL